MLSDYVKNALEPTLLFSLFMALIGVIAARHYGSANWLLAPFIVLGAVLSQVAVNAVNDYHDFKSGLDKETLKTRFSGGNIMLVRRKIEPGKVLIIGIAAAIIAGAIGAAAALLIDPLVLAIIAVGAVSIFAYSSEFSRVPFFSEPLCALNFALIAVGAYVLVHGFTANLTNALFAFIPAGMVIGATLLVNEVPDKGFDEKYGRMHAAVMLRSNRGIADYYALLIFLSYLIVVVGVAILSLNYFFLFALMTAFPAYFVRKGIAEYRSEKIYEKYMALNVVSSLAFLVLLLLGFAA